MSKSERLNGLRDPVLKLRDRSSEVRSFSVRLQRIHISVSLFFPRCCSEATTRSRANASARTTFGRGRPLAGPEEERTSPCPAHCPSGRDETRPNSRRNVDARSLRRQPHLGHVIGDARHATQWERCGVHVQRCRPSQAARRGGRPPDPSPGRQACRSHRCRGCRRNPADGSRTHRIQRHVTRIRGPRKGP